MARIYLSNEDADVSGYKAAYVNTRRPATTALATSVTDTAASGNAIQCTATAGGTALKWITKPFTAAVTITSAIAANIWAYESAAAANANVMFALYQYTGGSEAAAFWAYSPAPAELSAAGHAARQIFVTTLGTATAFAAGDRLVVKLWLGNTGTMGASETVTVDFDGPTEGVDGDTFLELCEAIRVNEQQIGSGSSPVNPGLGQGFFQNIIDGINAAADAGVLKKSNAIQTLVDELGFQRDNL